MTSGNEPPGSEGGALPGRFPNTRWTLVGRAGGTDNHAAPLAIAEIVGLYAPALRAHLRHLTRGDEHRAEDLLQGFLTEKVLEQRLIGYADPNRGRFRTFLLTALDRYVIDEHRRSRSQKRAPGDPLVDIDRISEGIADRATRSNGPTAFDLAWAREVVDEVVSTMRAECEQSNRRDLWEVFDVRYLKPATLDVAPEPHDSIARRLRLESAQQSGNLLTTAKRMFTRLFKSVVSRYAVTEEEMRDEVTELWRIFAEAKG